jgi:thioredoxin 1
VTKFDHKGSYLCGNITLIFIKMGKFNEIVQSEIPTLVDFHATWCGPCKMMSPILDQLKSEMGSQVRILKIDVDKNQEVANTFKVRGVPTFVLFKNGEILWRQSGGMDYNTLKNKITQAISPVN